jgi:hypothetical protein
LLFLLYLFSFILYFIDIYILAKNILSKKNITGNFEWTGPKLDDNVNEILRYNCSNVTLIYCPRLLKWTCPSFSFDKTIRGWVVKVIDFKALVPLCCGFKSLQGLWIFSCEEALQLAYETSVVLLRCPFVPEIMHGTAPEVFLHQ